MDLYVFAFALAAAFFFALALILTQFGLRHAPPLRGAAVSVPVAACLFIIAAPLTIEWAAWDWRAVSVFAGVGLLFPVLVTLLTFQSNLYVGPNVTGAVGNLAPIVAVVLAVFFLAETPGWPQIAGLVVIVGGVSLIFLSRGGGGKWPLWAILLPLGGAIIRGVVQPAVKLGLDFWPNPFAAVTIGYLVSAIVMLAVSIQRDGWPYRGMPRFALLWFASVGLCNGMAVFTMYAALDKGSVSDVAPLVAVYPVITLALSVVILRGVKLSAWLAAGVAVTVLGVVLLLAG